MNSVINAHARLLGGLTLLLVLPLLQSSAYAQQPMIVKTATYGGPFFEQVLDAAPASDGGAIVVGYTESFGAGESDIYLVKLDSQGDTIWTRTLGTPIFEQGTCVMQTADGDYLIGAGSGIGDSYDGLVIRTDSQGTERWNVQFDWDKDAEINDIVEMSDGSILLAGAITDPADQTTEGWLSKLDKNGSEIWTNATNYGGVSGFTSIEASDETSVFIGGYTSTSRSSNIEGMVVFVSPNGNFGTTLRYGGQAEYYAFTNVFRYPGGGIVGIGTTKATAAGEDADLWFIRTDEDGVVLASETQGGDLFDAVGNAIQTSDGGYAVVGTTLERSAGDRDVWVVRLNDDGITQWSITEGGPGADIGVGIIELGNDGYLVTGTTAESPDASADLSVMLLSPDPVTGVHNSPVAGLSPSAGAFPNPAIGSTLIKWADEGSRATSLVISDFQGRTIRHFDLHQAASSSASIRWDGTDDAGRRVPAGSYMCSIQSEEGEVVRVAVAILR